MRSSFRDWAGDVAHAPREIAEAVLAHTVGNQTERAYRRGDALEQRRKLMEAWAAYVAGDAGANVVELNSRRAWSDAKLKADIAFAELYRDSGLTQAAIGKLTGQSQSIVSRLLTYGEFIALMPMGIKPPERTFRGLWAKTEGSKAERFAQVEQMLMNPPKKERAPLKRHPQINVSLWPNQPGALLFGGWASQKYKHVFMLGQRHFSCFRVGLDMSSANMLWSLIITLL
jgi:hypothetical protein